MNEPKDIGRNVLEGVKQTYEAVAVRHVHPWWSWALLAIVIGFSTGALYVTNQSGKFEAGHAQQMCPADCNNPIGAIGEVSSAVTTGLFAGIDGYYQLTESEQLEIDRIADEEYPKGYTKDEQSQITAEVNSNEEKLAELRVAAKTACTANLKSSRDAAVAGCVESNKNCKKSACIPNPPAEPKVTEAAECGEATCEVTSAPTFEGIQEGYWFTYKCTSRSGLGKAYSTCRPKVITPGSGGGRTTTGGGSGGGPVTGGATGGSPTTLGGSGISCLTKPGDTSYLISLQGQKDSAKKIRAFCVTATFRKNILCPVDYHCDYTTCTCVREKAEIPVNDRTK